ncbi:InlB B-repeat-containing protein [Bifidobacterium simiarum]|uniref:InlB B-repeat-containing protein n=1 Tax=Bifidobacterium simiarum TaxID=2045441 RepID=UPI001BDCEDAD|nr:InlB B-repeat-containing protein [Bifidobacterium simiarum]MBT1167183.1 InlB B-repeat-containing protein [Bifidobacterium simiarum]
MAIWSKSKTRAGAVITAVLAMLLTVAVTPSANAAETPDQAAAVAQKKLDQGTIAYFRDKGATNAVNMLTDDSDYGIRYLQYVHHGEKNDATSLDNMFKALDYIKQGNKIRSDEGVRVLKVTDSNMAIAEAAADWASVNQSHLSSPENLSWSPDPYSQWYTWEKANYQEAIRQHPDIRNMTGSELWNKYPDIYEKVGHYLGLLDPTMAYTGFGVSHNGDYAYQTNAQEFQSDKNAGGLDRIMTVDAYIADLKAWKAEQESIIAKAGYTVSFDSAGGSAVASQKVSNGAKAVAPANPTRNGYSFTGWYNGSAEYDFSRPVTGNLTLTAHWTRNTPQVVYRTVSFDSVGGSQVASQRVANGAKAMQPKNPTRSGYSFTGWYSGSARWDFSKPVTGNLTLTAHWTKNQTKPTDPSKPSAKRVPVYRVYNRNSGLHHYTTSKAENDMLVRLGWRDENHGKSSFITVSKDTPGARPVYREYNRRSGNHNWTLNKAEHDMLVRLGWKDEGIAWYTSPTGQNVYRLYNPKPYHKPKNGRGNGGGEHVYTTSYGEYLAVVRAGWRGEGVAWKSL